MKKILFIVLGGALIAGSGCKEKAPTIVLEKKAVVDSPYTVSAIPATDPHNVLVEEFTGQTCPNCPKAHEDLSTMKTNYGGHVVILGLYKYNIGQTVPPHDAIYDFRDSAATLIGDQVYNGVNQLPTAGIDRVPVGGILRLNSSDWDPTVSKRVTMVDSLNLKVESKYDESTKEVTVTANIVYTKPVAAAQSLTIAIVEDSLVDKQDVPVAFPPKYPDNVDPAYVFTNVFRGTITAAPFGDPILPAAAVKNAGTALQRRYIYKLKSNIVNPAHCRVVAFVSNAVAGNGTIAQAAETKLKP